MSDNIKELKEWKDSAMNKYEIHIGKALNANNLRETIPLQKIIITQEQIEVIEMFASQRKDAELNTIYKLNECEFRILPHFYLEKCEKCRSFDTENCHSINCPKR